jgi:hypothetical protein
LTPTLVVVTVISRVTLRMFASVKVTEHEPASFAVTVIVVPLEYGPAEIAAIGPGV